MTAARLHAILAARSALATAAAADADEHPDLYGRTRAWRLALRALDHLADVLADETPTINPDMRTVCEQTDGADKRDPTQSRRQPFLACRTDGARS
jgi:hypothetical protein